MASISTGLSDLSDDLLRRVLYFAPAFEGAATAVLARRWRTLWRSSGAVNLHWLCGDPAGGDGGTSSRMERLGFLRRAESALAAVHAEGTVRRLTLHVVADHNHHTLSVLSSRRVGDSDSGDVIGSMLSNPAARQVEELSVIVHISSYTGEGSGINKFGGVYELSNGALPSEALRVLHVTNCRNIGLSPAGTAFPWLASLRLEGCTVILGHLQIMINTAPQLATLHLEWSFLAGEVGVTRATHVWSPLTRVDVECYQLRCPAGTDLVLVNCKWAGSVQGGMKLNMPNLRYFRYAGFIGRVSLKSGMRNLARADLHFLDKFHSEEKMRNKMSELFWKFLQNFDDTKILKVKLNCPIEDIAIADEGCLDELLGRQLFRHLECLEVEAWHIPLSRAAAVAMANLLHCCPGVRDLQLRLRTTMSRLPVIPFDEDEEDDDKYEVSDIPELSKYSFNCLQSFLRRVRLQFQLEYVNCFQVQLAKFLAENALVLEQMYIEDPHYKVREYINRRIRRWISGASKRKNSSSTAYAEYGRPRKMEC